MKKLLLAMTALTAVGLYASGANADEVACGGCVAVGPTALSAGFSAGSGDAWGRGWAVGKGTAGTSSGGLAGFGSIGQGGGTTFQNAVLPGAPNGTDNSNNHTYAGGTSAAIGGGATEGFAFADTNGTGGYAKGKAGSYAGGSGHGFSISAATTISPFCISNCVAQ